MKKSEKIAGISFLLVAVFYIGMYALGGVSEINITDASFVKNIVLIAAFVLLGVAFLANLHYVAVVATAVVAVLMGISAGQGIYTYAQVDMFSLIFDWKGMSSLLLLGYITYPLGMALAAVTMIINIIRNNVKKNTSGLVVLTVIFILISTIPMIIFIVYCLALLKFNLSGTGKAGPAVIMMLGLFICYIIGFIAGSCTYKIKMTKRNNYVPYNDIDLNNPYATSGSDPLSNNGSANPYTNLQTERKYYEPDKDVSDLHINTGMMMRQRISKKSTYQEHIRKRKMIYLLLLNLLKISEVTDINN